jgi:hypothetical protein
VNERVSRKDEAMLLRFEVSNHRSILEPTELSMIAVDAERTAVRTFELLSEPVLTVAGIYGPNASGKTNILDAIAWLATAVARSLRTWDAVVPRDPFKFGDAPSNPTTFEVEMMVDGVRYIYHLDVSDTRVLFEGLYSYPERRRRVLFERDSHDFRLRRGLGTIAGARELLTPTTLALSAAMRFNEPEVRPFGRSLAGIRARGLRRTGWAATSDSGPDIAVTRRLFEEPDLSAQATLFDDPDAEPVVDRRSALAMLRFADLGIHDVQVVDSQEDGAGPLGVVRTATRARRRQLQFIHRVAGQELPLDYTEESAGTQTWFTLIGPALSALRAGRVLLFDEIDASLHPQLSAHLLELFQDPETNPLGAQLIFTTHDTSLLNHLNRDEVWLTEKVANGSTVLTALAEFGGDKVRRSLNLEKAYLQGRFGAVPELDQFALRQALGMLPDDER